MRLIPVLILSLAGRERGLTQVQIAVLQGLGEKTLNFALSPQWLVHLLML